MVQVRASVLDRLLDSRSGESGESVQSSLTSLGGIKKAVVRDLENLLNTRRYILPLPLEYQQLNRSLHIYGLRDFTAENPGSIMVKKQLQQDIEKAIVRFEPRLKNVKVTLETEMDNERRLRFRITGLLVVEPASEPVTFDTYIDTNSGKCVVSGG